MDARGLAQTLWEYHHVEQQPERADIILGLGSNDLYIPRYAAQLFLDGYAPYVVFTGGVAHHGDLLETGWEKSEADTFAEIAKELGVPEDKIIIENQAQNTGDNFRRTAKLLEEKGISFQKVLLVSKPYMERRALATGQVEWPTKELIAVSEPVSFEAYLAREEDPDKIIHIMVGDMQRLKLYGEKGFQTPQEIPQDVWDAYEQLVLLGYTKHLISH